MQDRTFFRRRTAAVAVIAAAALALALAWQVVGVAGFIGGGAEDGAPASGKVGAIAVTEAIVLQSTIDVAGAYFTVTNTGSQADELLGVAVDASVTDSAGMHETVNTGASSFMPMIDRLAIPPGATVRFETGGYHVMLEGVRAPLNPGDSVKLRFTFARAGTLELVAPVWSYTRFVNSTR